jgi:hypothetical protein
MNKRMQGEWKTEWKKSRVGSGTGKRTQGMWMNKRMQGEWKTEWKKSRVGSGTGPCPRRRGQARRQAPA